MAARFALRFRRDERGATAIEYGLILAMIALVIVGAMRTFSTLTGENYDFISAKVTSALGGEDS